MVFADLGRTPGIPVDALLEEMMLLVMYIGSENAEIVVVGIGIFCPRRTVLWVRDGLTQNLVRFLVYFFRSWPYLTTQVWYAAVNEDRLKKVIRNIEEYQVTRGLKMSLFESSHYEELSDQCEKIF